MLYEVITSDLRGALLDTYFPSFQGSNPYIPLNLTNAIGATSYGLEASLDWLPRHDWRLQASVSLFHIEDQDAVAANTGAEFIGTDPTHQISVRSSFDITPAVQWDVWLRHVGKLV